MLLIVQVLRRFSGFARLKKRIAQKVRILRYVFMSQPDRGKLSKNSFKKRKMSKNLITKIIVNQYKKIFVFITPL